MPLNRDLLDKAAKQAKRTGPSLSLRHRTIGESAEQIFDLRSLGFSRNDVHRSLGQKELRQLLSDLFGDAKLSI